MNPMVMERIRKKGLASDEWREAVGFGFGWGLGGGMNVVRILMGGCGLHFLSLNPYYNSQLAQYHHHEPATTNKA